jgi:hypothetical protein
VKRWLTFLRNHREAIAAMDFFTVPTLTLGVLYCFFVIGHDRRKILHFHVTRNPLLFDRDAKFGADVVSAVRNMGSQPTRTAFRSPWQNGVAARWVGSCRRDLLDHVIILKERHLQRLMSAYLLYYHEAGLISDLRRTRQPVALSQLALGLKARFNPFRDSAACTIVMRWRRRLKSYCSEDSTLFL